ncbi:MAG: Xaa-Pro peptidase family protein [Acidimicrobiia bacterium]
MGIDYERRWARASELMQAAGIDAVFVMKPANLAYLSGDGRPCALALLTAAGEYIVSVPECDRPGVEAAARATEVRTFRSEEEMFHGYRDLLADRGLDRATIGLEKNFFDASLHEVFAAHILPNAEVVSATPVLSRLRMCKDADEIELMRGAARVAAVGMEAAVDAARAGVSEILIAGEAEYAMRRAGAEGWGIPTYVASGARTAMAHGPASPKVVESGDVVQIHLSPIAGGYTVDLCRTVFVGEPPADAARLLDVYLEAVDAGIAAAAPGAPLLGIDAALAAVLHDAGLDDAFLRPTFHGVGIEHEEAPIPGGHAVVHGEAEIESVEAGMALAIGNCGIYREAFGVRNEDTVWVSPDGPVVLTRVVLAGETTDSATAD